MVNVIDITTLAEIPAGLNRVLVKYGKASKLIRHSRGLTIEVDELLPDEIRDFSFTGEIESAKEIATQEGISTVFVLRSLG